MKPRPDRRAYMRKYHRARKAARAAFPKAHSITHPAGRSGHTASEWAIRTEHIATNMWPEYLLRLDDRAMVRAMHKRRGAL